MLPDKSKNFAASTYSSDMMVPGRDGFSSSSASNLKDNANDASRGLTIWNKGTDTMHDLDSVSLDCLPDIVDGDPDSD